MSGDAPDPRAILSELRPAITAAVELAATETDPLALEELGAGLVPAPVAGALRDVGQRTVNNVLAQPAVQTVWQDVNRRAHETFTRLINEDTSGRIQAQGNEVILDLQPLVQRVKDRLGISGSLRPDAGKIRIMTAQNLDTARTAVKAVKWVSMLASILAIALLVAAMWLARGRRRMLLWIGVGLVAIGLALLIIRRVAGNLVVDGLTSSESIRPAVSDVWLISTSLLHYMAIALIVYGALAIVGAVLAGPTRAARWARGVLAPVFHRPVWTYAGLGFILLLAIWLGPNNSGRGWLATLVLLGLVVLGVEVLRRQTVAEHPEAAPAPT